MPIGKSETQVNKVFLSLGSNQGDRLNYLRSAIDHIEMKVGKVVLRSSFYETGAWGKEDQNDFLNAVVKVTTELKPENVLKEIHAIEDVLQRRRVERWGPRTIDIDILLYNNLIINNKDLEIPHPRMRERKFVLWPLAEIAPDLKMPQSGDTIRDLSTRCSDSSKISVFMPSKSL